MTRTIRRNSKHLTALMARDDLAGTIYTLDNCFVGAPLVGQNLREWFARWRDDISVRQAGDKIVLHFHSNCWVEVPA